jgi:DNA-directed RNA polymerase specialized sigma24 family protein
MIALAARTIQKTETLTILHRIAEKDKTAVKDCIDAYGNFIWALAKKFTASNEEAEAATTEIFTDIWQYADRTRSTPQSTEKKLIAMIALRRLIKSSRQAEQISMADIDASNEQGAGKGRISEFI